MRTLSLKISLENYCSRLPGVIPAYYNNDLYTFDKDSIIKDIFHYTSNYGMRPLNVVLSGVTYKDDGTGQYALTAPNGWDKCGLATLTESTANDFVVLAWSHISDIFSFFRKYYTLLNENNYCNAVYTSATQYFEVKTQNDDESSMVYGTNSNTYENLDTTFKCYGGKINIKEDVDDENSENKIVTICDDGFFKWLSTNVVPSFQIPNQYADGYPSTYLYYPDALYWAAWLERLSTQFTDDKDWTQTALCCEYQEFCNKGGKGMLSALTEWLDDVNEQIVANNTIFKANIKFQSQIPNLKLNVLLTNFVEDLGEMTIFSKEWEGGIDYGLAELRDYKPLGTAKSYLSSNASGGTVVVYNNETFIAKTKTEIDRISTQNSYNNLNTKCYGYKYDERYGTFVFGNDVALVLDTKATTNGVYKSDKSHHWNNYTEDFIQRNKQQFYLSAATYAYTVNNKKVANPTPLNMTKRIQVDTNNDLGYIVIKNEILPIFKHEYIVCSSASNPYLIGQALLVYRDTYTNIPYVTVKNHTYYAKCKDAQKGTYKFFLNDSITFNKYTVNPEHVGEFITYKKTNLWVRNNEVKIWATNSLVTDKALNGATASTISKIAGYFSYEGGNYYVGRDQSTMEQSQDYQVVKFDTSVNETTKEIKTTLIANDDWQSQDLSQLKLSDLLASKTYYAINEISGKIFIDVVTKYKECLSNYVYGTVRSRLNEVQQEEILEDDIGNKMGGYYDASDGKHNYPQPNDNEELELYYNVGVAVGKRMHYYSNNKQYFIGNIIKEMKFYYLDSNEVIIDDTCLNATISIGDTQPRKTLSVIKALIDKYEETYQEAKLPYCDITYNIGATLYYDNDNKTWRIHTEAHQGVEYTETLSFLFKSGTYQTNALASIPVTYYDIVQQYQAFNLSDYGLVLNLPVAALKMQIMTFNPDLDKEIFTQKNGFKKNNGLIVAPVYRPEYLLGVCMPENIDNGIYIDRGANYKFEQHLKLGEVSSLQALENYGNGFFNLISD